MAKIKRGLPVYAIEGTDFIVDIEKRSLIEAGDPNNTIDFIDLHDKGTHYKMLYDLRDKNSPPGVGPMDDQMIGIKIPPMVVLDPAGVAEKYGLTIAELKGKTDLDIMAAEIQSAIRWPIKTAEQIRTEEQKDNASLLPKLHQGKHKRMKI